MPNFLQLFVPLEGAPVSEARFRTGTATLDDRDLTFYDEDDRLEVDIHYKAANHFVYPVSLVRKADGTVLVDHPTFIEHEDAPNTEYERFWRRLTDAYHNN